jgi:predicted dienelactone hydrolase
MSAKSASFFGDHLASHGFFVVGVERQDSAAHWGKWLIDYPADQVFALEQFVASPPAGFEGLIDGENAGAAGYSFDGYDALALSGARIDPAYYLSQCETAEPKLTEPEEWWLDYVCNMYGGWEAFDEYASPLKGDSTGGLWQPITSPRIKAVMPMAPEGAWLFGPEGLAAADRPALILGGTEDDINYYHLEIVTIFEQLGSQDKNLISFSKWDHFMIFDENIAQRMNMLATAFFSYHLKDEDEYLNYLSEEYINEQFGLEWGAVP